MNLHDAIALYRLQLEANGRSSHTLAQADRHLRRFAEWLGDTGGGRDIATIDAVLVAHFFVSAAARTCANGRAKKATSMNAMRSSLRAFFCYLHDAGHVAANPTRLLRRARCAPPPPRALSKEDQGRLLEALAGAPNTTGHRDHALFHLLLATGLRIGSALALRVENVDLGNAEITVMTAKGNRPTRVFLAPAICEHVRKFIADRTTGPLFPGRGGEPIDRRHAHRRLASWITKAGVRQTTSPHCLRHSFATDLYQRTGDLFLVKAALNHASIASTTIYATISLSRLRQAFG